MDEAKALEEELRDAGVRVSFQFYEGAGHAFFNDTNRLGTYDARGGRAGVGTDAELPPRGAGRLRLPRRPAPRPGPSGTVRGSAAAGGVGAS